MWRLQDSNLFRIGVPGVAVPIGCECGQFACMAPSNAGARLVSLPSQPNFWHNADTQAIARRPA